MVPRYLPCPKTPEQIFQAQSTLHNQAVSAVHHAYFDDPMWSNLSSNFQSDGGLLVMFMRRFRICIKNTRSGESFSRYGTSVDRIEVLQTYLTSDQKSDVRREFAMSENPIVVEISPKALTVTEKSSSPCSNHLIDLRGRTVGQTSKRIKVLFRNIVLARRMNPF